MKKTFTLLFGIVFLITVLNAQEAPPQAFSYKASFLRKNGKPLDNSVIGLRFSILQNSIDGASVYTETFKTMTNLQGQIDIEIGHGTVQLGDFSFIEWSTSEYFLKTEVDLNGGTNYQLLSVAQLLSVPYALYAGEAGSAINESDPIFSTHPAFGITNDNINDWNTAFGWGNHAGLYRPIDYIPSWSEITSKPTTIAGFGITDAVMITGDQTINGNKSFSRDLLVNGLNVGRGKNTGVGNAAFGEQALFTNGGGYQNTANGVFALYSNTEGAGNTAVGYNALFINETGSDNTAIGANALYQNKGSYNTAIGLHALYRNTDGYSNTANGVGALEYNSAGFRNTATGVEALYSNTTGWFNTANGVGALYSNTDGKQNTAIGFYALYGNITGFGNTAVGTDAGHNTMGDNNVFLGYSAGSHETGSNKLFIDNQERANESDARTKSLIYGIFDANPANQILTINGNVGIGTITPASKLDVTGDINFTGVLLKNGSPYAGDYNALENKPDLSIYTTLEGDQTINGNKTFSNDILVNGLTIGKGNNAGYDNIAFGLTALYSNTDGIHNTANGTAALYSNTTGSYNTANGAHALFYNTAGTYNTAIGFYSLYSNITGNDNTANGRHALYSNTTGSDNTAIGSTALSGNTTGAVNTAIGSGALGSNKTGNHNTASGYFALFLNTTGSVNTADGTCALNSNTTGENNTAIGHNAIGMNTTGSGNTALGVLAGLNNITGNNNTFIGYRTYAPDGDLTNATAIGYKATVHASNKIVLGNTEVTSIGGWADWTNYSDSRLKENIVYRNELGLNFITRLRPASFKYANDENKRRHDGLIAQDVEQILKELGLEFSGLIIDDDSDKTMNLSYPAFVIPLITAVQEQQKQIEEQQKQIDELKKLVGTLAQQ
jgi:trimeric autotransporter adhesin